MTGATGDLTPDDSDRPFIPAELREISNPAGEGAPDDDLERAGGGSVPDESDGDELSDREERY
jgi:hypothetical protein